MQRSFVWRRTFIITNGLMCLIDKTCCIPFGLLTEYKFWRLELQFLLNWHMQNNCYGFKTNPIYIHLSFQFEGPAHKTSTISFKSGEKAALWFQKLQDGSNADSLATEPLFLTENSLLYSRNCLKLFSSTVGLHAF